MRLPARSLVVLALTLGSSVAFGQPSVAPPPPPPGGDPPAAEEPKAAAREAAGYAYSDKRPARSSRRRVVRAGPLAVFPGFEQVPGGGSRLWVHLTQQVPVEERRAPGTITYVLKGAHVRVHNDTNALVTVHFNTPVTRARLVPRGADLHFVVELRADVQATHRFQQNEDKTSTLLIDLPAGNYATAEEARDPAAADAPAGDGSAKPARPSAQKSSRPSARPPAPPPPSAQP